MPSDLELTLSKDDRFDQIPASLPSHLSCPFGRCLPARRLL